MCVPSMYAQQYLVGHDDLHHRASYQLHDLNSTNIEKSLTNDRRRKQRRVGKVLCTSALSQVQNGFLNGSPLLYL